MTARPVARNGNWALVAALVAAAVLSYVNRQAPTLLVDPLRRDLGLDDMQVSYLIGASFAVIYALSSLGFGWFADKVSRTRIIAVAILLWSAGSASCAFATGFWYLFGCRMVIGASEAALIPAALSLIGDAFPDRKRGLATGIFLAGIFGGAGGAIIIVGQLLGLAGQGWLAALPHAAIPWRQVFLLAALPGLLLVPVFLLWRDARTLAGRPDVGGLAGPLVGEQEGAGTAWPSVILLCAALTLLAISDNAMLAWGPSLLIRDYGMAAETVGHYLGLSLMLDGSAGVVIGGLLSDWRAKRAGGRLAICLVATALAMPMPLLMLGQQAPLIIASIGIYLALSSAATCAGVAALLALAAPQRRGLVSSILTLSTVAFGFGIGPSLTALVARALNDLASGLIVVSLASLLGAGLLFIAHLARPEVRTNPHPPDSVNNGE